MTTTRKKPKDGEGGMRIDSASDRPRRTGASRETQWLNPRESLPASMTEPTTRTIIDGALSIFPDAKDVQPDLLAAVLIAQALDRLGKSIVEAAAVSRYRGT
jgi:hypothetical protein